ncbi:MAG: hypothetical protein EXR94_11645 [Gemmatimonadetes bacterium]|nr:hypothetical protein [Gemmatimonadota bacterium]
MSGLGVVWAGQRVELGGALVIRTMSSGSGTVMSAVQSLRAVSGSRSSARCCCCDTARQSTNVRQRGQRIVPEGVGKGPAPSTASRTISTGLDRLRPYDLRHSAASLLLTADLHPKLVQAMLGHASIKLTLDTYSHLVPGLRGRRTKWNRCSATGRPPMPQLVPRTGVTSVFQPSGRLPIVGRACYLGCMQVAAGEDVRPLPTNHT